MTSPDQAEDVTRQPYYSDGVLYMLWKYLNGRRFTRKDTLTFEDLVPIGLNHIGATALLFVEAMSSLGLEIEGLNFDVSGYSEFQEKTGNEASSSLKKGTKEYEAVSRVMKGKFDFQDVVKGCLLFNKAQMVDYFEFSNHLSEETAVELGHHLDVYIDDFIEDNLEIEDRNFFRFLKQKEDLFYRLRSLEEKYGNQFITRFPKDFFVFGNEAESLFMHTLIASEKLGYYTIQDIWIDEFEIPVEKRSEDYKVRLVLTDQFYREVYPKRVVMRELAFDPKTSNLSLLGNTIEISKTKDSDPHYLLEILFKDKEKVWAYDEIWEDPYFHSREAEYDPQKDWRKIYHAARSVNEKVAKATTISDFLDFSKTAVSIDKKYLS
jgi:hypothetical protein